MKKYLSTVLLVLFIVPSVAFASWWNPFSWFNNWTFRKPKITTEYPVQKISIPTTTTTTDISSEVKTLATNTKQENPAVVVKTVPKKDVTQTQIQKTTPPVVINPTPIDVCNNIEGIQTSVPAGMTSTKNVCTVTQIITTPSPIPVPVDICSNISGNQSSIPSGMELINGNCVAIVVPPPTPTDICPNITGVQTAIPDGMILQNGNCITPMPANPPPVIYTSPQPPSFFIESPKGTGVGVSSVAFDKDGKAFVTLSGINDIPNFKNGVTATLDFQGQTYQSELATITSLPPSQLTKTYLLFWIPQLNIDPASTNDLHSCVSYEYTLNLSINDPNSGVITGSEKGASTICLKPPAQQ